MSKGKLKKGDTIRCSCSEFLGLTKAIRKEHYDYGAWKQDDGSWLIQITATPKERDMEWLGGERV